MIGPSGSGKSTFLRSLNGLEEITSGTVIVNGKDITDKNVNINKVGENVGRVFEHFNLFPHKTVIENIMMAPVLLKKMNKEQARQKAMELLNRVGLSEKADVYSAMLSGGQKQRLLLLFQKNMVLN